MDFDRKMAASFSFGLWLKCWFGYCCEAENAELGFMASRKQLAGLLLFKGEYNQASKEVTL